MEKDEKKTMASSMFMVGHAVRKDVDRARLSGMADPEFEKEVDALSEEIIFEIEELKKRYYGEGFKEALKQIKNAPEMQTQPQLVVQAQTPMAAVPTTTVVSVDNTQVESRLSSIDQKISEFSDRVNSVEQMVLSSSSHDEELRNIINENRELVSTLKERLSEIALLQSTIEEKVSQPQDTSSFEERMDEKLSTFTSFEGRFDERINALTAQIDNLGNLVVEEGSKINKVEANRKASVRRLDRKLNSISKKLEDFKKVRKQIRKQGKRITVLTDEVVPKTSFKTAIKRVSAKAAIKPKKAKRKAVKTVSKVSIKTTKSKRARKAAKVTSKRKVKAGKRSVSKKTASKKVSRKPAKISINAQTPTTVEINQKK